MKCKNFVRFEKCFIAVVCEHNVKKHSVCGAYLILVCVPAYIALYFPLSCSPSLLLSVCVVLLFLRTMLCAATTTTTTILIFNVRANIFSPSLQQQQQQQKQ